MLKNSNVEYHYLNKFGSVKGLNKNNPNLEKKTFLVLDSSVCLDIISIVNKKHINKDSKRKAFELIKYSQKKSMPIFEILALLELSFEKSTFKLNTEKLLDFSNKLKFAFQFPLERISQMKIYNATTWITNKFGLFEPLKNFIIQKDFSISKEIILTPNIAQEGEVKIKWSFLARDFNDEGELIIKIRPKFIEKQSIMYVLKKDDCKTAIEYCNKMKERILQINW